MDCTYTTGQIISAPGVGANPYAGPSREKPNTLFGPLSTSGTSRTVHVEPGEAVLFTGHSFYGGLITLNRLWYTPGIMPQSDPCTCPPKCLTIDPGHTDFVKPVSIACNGFVLGECTDILAMSIPGYYNLTLDDPAMIGTVFVDYRIVAVKDIPQGLLVSNFIAPPPKVVAVVPAGTGHTLIYDDGTTAPLVP